MSTTDNAIATNQPSASVGVATQVIYADRILSFGIGASVARLTLGMEAGENTFVPVAQIVIPTPSLFEALQVMATKIATDDELKKGIVDAMDAFKASLTKTT
jgi:hypothetical protein